MARRRPTPAARARARAEELAAYVTASPSSYHAAAEAAARLENAGFTVLDERAAWPNDPGGYVTVRDGAFIAWRIPEHTEPHVPFAIVGAHTDSPGFRLKPSADRDAHGWRQLAVEVYGGPLLNSWLDRELRLAGRVVLRDGRSVLVATDAVARIPQLAVHLDRSVNQDGVRLDAQLHTAPILGPGSAPSAVDLLAQAAEVDAAEIAGWDVGLADAQPPLVFGAGQAMLASGRLDNLVSVHAALAALIETVPTGVVPVVAAFDHEEVGSDSRSGAAGPFLEDVLARIQDGLGTSPAERVRSFAASWCVSSDVGHSVHPNYAERHDDSAPPIAGGGPIIKINAQQRYATDARGTALWKRVCDEAGVKVQTFVSRNTIPSGSTIGPISATRLGIATVDVGIPILSMHSARELCAASDVDDLGRALGVFLAGAWPEHA
ncbi:M18 family aminopeptidase [Pseudoclavibacter chungangensis]|uniref:M18 family aminopeptidase n=1 Tax=Pseudoclavibacter chungangensis TaxID=587635 RepID=A0A7J5BU58_9MICO|nr:M18 family aminopeptidase [Pseudoclavibacter chungangensis]KAB1657878.1 M18 family aminopeptidase [Pseudoclavibacter chungangensis]NYJ66519.1 aspartyl aminopeptidase [Pseudoclavibacter chungangensis]